MSTFKLVGLDHEPFVPLFDLSNVELAAQGIVRRIADSDTGFPCRISLEDAGVGDELLMIWREVTGGSCERMRRFLPRRNAR